MNWLTDWYDKHPEYRQLRQKRTRNSIHFELEPNLYEAHIWIDPRFQRTSTGLLVPFSRLTEGLRLAGQLLKSPRALAHWAALLPFGTVMTLQPAAADGIDNYLDSPNANTNHGATNQLAAGHATVANAYRTVIKFTLTSLPAGAVVSLASFGYTLGAGTMAGTAATAYCARILAGNSGWTEAGSTWNKIDGASAWAGSAGCNTSGTDYSATPLYGPANPPNAVGANSIALVVSEFTLMVAANYGWVFGYPTTGNYRWPWSSDNATPANRPTLTVTYSLPGGGIFNPVFAGSFRGPFG